MADTQARRWWRRIGYKALLLPAGVGALGGLGHPPFDLFFLTIAAFATAFLWLGRSASAARAFWLGLSFGAGYFAVSIQWIVEPFFVDPVRHGWMAPFALVFMAVGLALFWAVAFWGARKLAPNAWPIMLTLTAAEILRTYVLTGFAWGMPSYVLVDQKVALLAAWVGPHGLNLGLFVVAWCGAQVLALRGKARIVAAVLALLGVLGVARAAPDAEPNFVDAPVVRLIQPNAAQREKWDPAHMRRFFETAVGFTAAAPDYLGRPDLVVWPETSVPTLLHQAQNILEIVSTAAGGAPVVLGINRFEGARIYNSAILLDGDGAVTQIYDKHHLVPFGEYVPLGNLLGKLGLRGFASQHGEGYSAGPGPVLLDLGPLGKALPLICYEAVFPQDLRGTSERPRVILHITNDAWFGNFSGPYQHLAQARMRAIEMGLPVLRAANTGVSAAIDARGQITAQLPLNEAGYLDVALPEARPPTLYAGSGDTPMMVLLSLLLAVLTLRAIRKTD